MKFYIKLYPLFFHLLLVTGRKREWGGIEENLKEYEVLIILNTQSVKIQRGVAVPFVGVCNQDSSNLGTRDDFIASQEKSSTSQ